MEEVDLIHVENGKLYTYEGDSRVEITEAEAEKITEKQVFGDLFLVRVSWLVFGRHPADKQVGAAQCK